MDSRYFKTAAKIFQKAISTNDNFVLWGTCQGFQMLNAFVAKDPSVVEPGFDSEDISWPIEITEEGFFSRFISSLPYDGNFKQHFKAVMERFDAI